MTDILDQIDALTDGPTTTYLDPVIPSGRGQNNPNMEWDKAEAMRPVATSGVESMFSVRKSPWHEIGNVIPEALRSTDIETILTTAGMNWTVSKRPVRVASKPMVLASRGPKGEEVLETVYADEWNIPTDEFSAMVRDDTGAVLGMVGKAYTPFQNADSLDLLNDVLLSGETTVETAGVLFGGKKVWVLANVPRDLTIEGDVHVPYLCVSTTHDGSGSIRADLTMLRVECQNSLRWAIRNPHLLEALKEKGITSPSPSWTHRHSTNVKSKAADARRILGFAVDFLDAYEAEIEGLMAKVVSDGQFDRLVKGLLPVADDVTDRQKANVEEKRNKVRAFYEAETDGGKFKGTAWGVLQAFSSYDLWGADLKGGESTRSTRQIVRLLDGTVEKRTSTVLDRIAALR